MAGLFNIISGSWALGTGAAGSEVLRNRFPMLVADWVDAMRRLDDTWLRSIYHRPLLPSHGWR